MSNNIRFLFQFGSLLNKTTSVFQNNFNSSQNNFNSSESSFSLVVWITLFIFLFILLSLILFIYYMYQQVQSLNELTITTMTNMKEIESKIIKEEEDIEDIEEEDKSKELQFILECKNLSYKTNNITLLNDITARFYSNRITGLMGVSGAGKTTLLQVLSANKHINYHQITGSLTLYQKNKKNQYQAICNQYHEFNKYIQFIPIDIPLLSSLTVWEYMIFLVRLNLSTIALSQQYNLILKMLIQLGLDHILNVIIKNISTGERKRLILASQLILKPNILLLDEITSGLDSYNAKLLLTSLSLYIKQEANTSLCCILSIHQPSLATFELLDDVIILGTFGNLIYTGTRQQLHSFLLSIPKAIRLPIPFNKDQADNIADYLIDITGNPDNYQLLTLLSNYFKQNQNLKKNFDFEISKKKKF